MDKTPLLYVTVRNPSGTQYQGHANAVTAYNDSGSFDIMGYHTNFISIIKKSLIIHEGPKKDVTIPVENGILKVSENNIVVFVGINNIS